MSETNHSGKSTTLRVGTRESKLARIQTDIVVRALAEKFSDLSFEVVPITTGGDKVQDRPIADLGTRGVFVKELEDALYDKRVDFVVHSLKDMPTELPPGLTLAAVMDRADARDVLISNNGVRLEQLPRNSRVATSSRRRTAQLKAIRPDLTFCDIRGNIQTRLRKHDEGQCDAMVLAAAGLLRLGIESRISEYFDIATCTPAVGQGALAIECRENENSLIKYLLQIEDPLVRSAIDAERAFLDKLGGGCSVPIGAYSQLTKDGKIALTGCVAALDGSQIMRQTLEAEPKECIKLGVKLAEQMIARGADKLLRDLLVSTPAAISPP